MLLVMMRLDSCGFAVRIESVHIWWCSILSTICGPSMACMNCGRATVSSVPSSAPARKIASAAVVYGSRRRKILWITLREKLPHAREVHPVAGVDVIMRAADEAVEVCFKGAGGLVGPDGGEVGCGLPVEQAELAQVRRATAF